MTPIKSESQASPSISERFVQTTQNPWVRVAIIVATVAAVAIAAATIAAILITPAGCPALIAGLATFLIVNKIIVLSSAAAVGTAGTATLIASHILSNQTPSKESTLSRTSSDSSLASLDSTPPGSPRRDDLLSSGLTPLQVRKLQTFKETYNPHDDLFGIGAVLNTETLAPGRYSFTLNPTHLISSTKPDGTIINHTYLGVDYPMPHLFFKDNIGRAQLIDSVSFQDGANIQIRNNRDPITVYLEAKRLIQQKFPDLTEAHRNKILMTLLKYITQSTVLGITSITGVPNMQFSSNTTIENRSVTESSLRFDFRLNDTGVPEILLEFNSNLTAISALTSRPIPLYDAQMTGSLKLTVPATEDLEDFTESDQAVSRATLTIH